MKLTTREAIMIGLLGVAVIAFGVFRLVIEPYTADIEQLRGRLASLEASHQEIAQYSDVAESMRAQLESQNQQIEEITAKYFPAPILERIMMLTEELYDAVGTQPGSYSFPRPASGEVFVRPAATVPPVETVPLDELVRQLGGPAPVAPGRPGPAQFTSPKVYTMTWTLPFQGTYEQVLTFFTSVREWERKLLVSSFSLSGSPASVSASFTVHYYGIPKPYYIEDEYSTWDRLGPYERTTPFRP